MHEGRLHDNERKCIAIHVGHPSHSGDLIRKVTYNAFYNDNYSDFVDIQTSTWSRWLEL